MTCRSCKGPSGRGRSSLRNKRRAAIPHPLTKARSLRAARDGACRFFDGVLSPDYNIAHADPLHLEWHRARVCR